MHALRADWAHWHVKFDVVLYNAQRSVPRNVGNQSALREGLRRVWFDYPELPGRRACEEAVDVCVYIATVGTATPLR